MDFNTRQLLRAVASSLTAAHARTCGFPLRRWREVRSATRPCLYHVTAENDAATPSVLCV
jgi:hypothetical protein